MTQEDQDLAARAAVAYRPDQLPVMNWPIRRPAEPPGPPVWRAAPYLRKKGMWGEPPPHVSTIDQLLVYDVWITCAGCGHGTAADIPTLLKRAWRLSFEHLVTTMTCAACGGQAGEIAICNKSDIPYADHAKLIYENPMCGRYSFTKSVDEIRGLFGFRNSPNLEPRYNIAPSQDVPVVMNVDDERDLIMMRWGLIPVWAKDDKIGYSTFNARLDSVATKPAFRQAFKSRHCLILADSFYEWEKPDAKTKLPWRFMLPDGGAFAFAGLWETWSNSAGETVTSCTIITKEPYKEVAPVHNRSPIILRPESYDDWLAATPTGSGGALGVDYYDGPLKKYRVSTAINNAKSNDHAGLAEPVTEDCHATA